MCVAQITLLRQLSKIDSMHEEKIKHEMIDDVWNSRRQRRPKKEAAVPIVEILVQLHDYMHVFNKIST